MPDWLRDAVSNGESLPHWTVLIARVGLSMVLGFLVAGVYAATLGRRRDEVRTLATTLVLLSVLIAIVTLVIGNSVARAFGLVGALSIVRFRTVVEDTRDTAFVIFAVAVGMAVGAGYTVLGVIAIPAVGLAALLMSAFERPPRATQVAVTVRLVLGIDPGEALGVALATHLDGVKLTATSTAKQGSALEVVYVGRLRTEASAVPLVTELNRVEGVQSVELH